MSREVICKDGNQIQLAPNGIKWLAVVNTSWTFGFHKKLGISWLAWQLSVFMALVLLSLLKWDFWHMCCIL